MDVTTSLSDSISGNLRVISVCLSLFGISAHKEMLWCGHVRNVMQVRYLPACRHREFRICCVLSTMDVFWVHGCFV